MTEEHRRSPIPMHPARIDRPEPTIQGEARRAPTPTLPVAAATTIGVLVFLWGLTLTLDVGAAVGLPGAPSPLAGIDVLGIGLVLALGPYGLQAARESRRTRRMEELFPDFLRDLAANRRAGFTLATSVELAADGEYGPLSPEIRRMAAQLSWNVPFEEALQRFADRVDTPLVRRASSLVLEAERTGGHITDVLDAVARDIRELKHLDNERRLSMRLYTVVMYIAFSVFLGVVLLLQTRMMPQLVQAGSGDLGGALSGLAVGDVTLEDYRVFFYVSTLVQAVGNGTVAGLMSAGEIGPGLQHASFMCLLGVLSFGMLLL